MRKNRREKIIIVIALVMGILCLSIGFASFSTMLNINSTAHITPNSDTFKIIFSQEKDIISTNPVIPTLTGSATGESAIINNNGNPKITGLKASFKSPGETVTYSFFSGNVGEYDAYLNKVEYLNIIGKNTFKTCATLPGTSENLVQNACNDITVSIKVGNEIEAYDTSTFSGHKLLKGDYEPIVVTIKYKEGGAVADGPFNINFGDIELTYSTVDNEEENINTGASIGETYTNIINIKDSLLEGIRNETEIEGYGALVFNNNWVINNLEPNTTYKISYDVECISIPEHDSIGGSATGFMLYSGVSGYNTIELYKSQHLIEGEQIHYENTFTTPDNLLDEQAKYKILVYTNSYKNGVDNVNSTMIFRNLELIKVS